MDRTTPAGVPISSRLAIPVGVELDIVRRVLGLIDAIHGDGAVPIVPVRSTRALAEAGVYEYASRTGRPLRIGVSSRAEQPHLAIAHEIGHLLDHQSIGRAGQFASETGQTESLMSVIALTESIRILRGRRSQGTVRLRVRSGSAVRYSIDVHLVEYLLSPREIFARAYAQYIAVVSRDQNMGQELDQVRHALASGEVYRRQWDDEDFTSVGAAMDRLLIRKGWRR